MKIFRLAKLAEINSDVNNSGEYLLSPELQAAPQVALRYCRLTPKESGRKLAAAAGNTEIVFVAKGNLMARSGKSTFHVSAGEAFFINGKNPIELDNAGECEAVYVIACSTCGQEGLSKSAATDVSDKPYADAIKPAGDESAGEEFEITRDTAEEK